MNAPHSTALTPQARADLIAAARARALHLRAQAKAEFVQKMIAGIRNLLSHLSKLFAGTLTRLHHPSGPHI